MNRLNYKLVAFFLLCINTIHSQNITGIVFNTDNEYVVKARVELKRNDTGNKNVQITDARGYFDFSNVTTGKYTLEITTDLYKTYVRFISVTTKDIDFGSIFLDFKFKKINLKEVVIENEKSIITEDLDKTIIDIENSDYSKGDDAYGLLNVIPGINADGSGKIFYEGDTKVTIRVDGKALGKGGNLTTSVLRTLNSEKVKAIELITNSSAENDAEGSGVSVNIILKEDYRYGLVGNIYTGYTQNRFNNLQNGINLAYRKSKFNIHSSYNIFDGKNFSDNTEIQQGLENAFIQEETYVENYKVNVASLGVDYNLSPKSIFVFNYDIIANDLNNKGIALTNNSIRNTNTRTINTKDLELKRQTISVGYKLKLDTVGSQISLNYSKVLNDRTNDSDIDSFFNNREADNFTTNIDIFNNLKAKANIYSLNYTKIIGKNIFKSGLKVNRSLTDNNIERFEGEGDERFFNAERSNAFDYDERIYGAFFTYKSKFKTINYKIGLRAEKTDYEGVSEIGFDRISRDFINLFPSVFLQKKVGKRNTIKLSYGRQIRRPDFNKLNPFEDIEDPFFVTRGNPNLQPSFSNKTELVFNYKRKYTFRASYINKKDLVNNLFITEGDRIISTYANLNDEDALKLSSFIPVKVASWYNMNLSASVTRRTIFLDNRAQSFTKYTPYFNFKNRFKLFDKKHFFEVVGYYFGNTFYSIYDLKPQGAIDVSYRTQLFKKKINLSVSATDIFGLKRINIIANEENFTRRIENSLPFRTLNVKLSYGFHKGKKEVKREDIEKQGGDILERLGD